MNIKDLSKPLAINQIEFRTQSVKKTNSGAGVIVLAYKNARVDMERLDEVVGALNWKREHTRDNKNCVVSIYCEDKKEWISKEDTGVESNTAKEKGLASDSFKRACFNWGIGRELYDFPFIYINLKQGEFTENNGNVKEYFVQKLTWKVEYDEKGNMIFLGAYKENVLRWSFGKSSIKIQPPLKPKEEIKLSTTDRANLDLLIVKINHAKSKAELTEIYNKETKFIENKEFMSALTNRKQALAKLFKE